MQNKVVYFFENIFMEVFNWLKKRYYGACVQYGKIEQKIKLDDKGVLPDRKHISVL